MNLQIVFGVLEVDGATKYHLDLVIEALPHFTYNGKYLHQVMGPTTECSIDIERWNYPNKPHPKDEKPENTIQRYFGYCFIMSGDFSVDDIGIYRYRGKNHPHFNLILVGLTTKYPSNEVWKENLERIE